MRSRRFIVFLWGMLLCVSLAMAGCRKSTGEENALVSVDETEIPEDREESPGEGSGDSTKDAAGAGPNAGEALSLADDAGTGIIYVDVCGQVKNPGVYQLGAESRVYEAVEMAGGMTKKAAAEAVNQAGRLTDGQQIYVPSKDEQASGDVGGQPGAGSADVQQASGSTGAGGADGGKVNLNTASKEELMTLSGIGEVKADAMVRYREEHGSFQSVEDVKKIEGIKDGVFNKIKDQITV